MSILIDEQEQFKKIATKLVNENIFKLNEEESELVVRLMNECFLYGVEFGLNNEARIEI